jgi:hypothetical protein
LSDAKPTKVFKSFGKFLAREELRSPAEQGLFIHRWAVTAEPGFTVDRDRQRHPYATILDNSLERCGHAASYVYLKERLDVDSVVLWGGWIDRDDSQDLDDDDVFSTALLCPPTPTELMNFLVEEGEHA